MRARANGNCDALRRRGGDRRHGQCQHAQQAVAEYLSSRGGGSPKTGVFCSPKTEPGGEEMRDGVQWSMGNWWCVERSWLWDSWVSKRPGMEGPRI
jgi:hypothetical protein